MTDTIYDTKDAPVYFKSGVFCSLLAHSLRQSCERLEGKLLSKDIRHDNIEAIRIFHRIYRCNTRLSIYKVCKQYIESIILVYSTRVSLRSL